MIYDITITPSLAITNWPGSPGYKRTLFRSLENGDISNDSLVCYDVHVGTHIESGLHRGVRGRGLKDFFSTSIRSMNFQVIEFSEKTPPDDEIDKIDPNTQVLLLKTGNSENALLDKRFRRHYTSPSLQFVLGLGRFAQLEAVGIDYITMEPLKSNGSIHKNIFNLGLLVIESAKVGDVPVGSYEGFISASVDETSEAATCQICLHD